MLSVDSAVMSEDFSRAWSWLSADQQTVLQQNPSGPVPESLVPRLRAMGILGGIGSSKLTTPTGGAQWYLPRAFAQFISQLPE